MPHIGTERPVKHNPEIEKIFEHEEKESKLKMNETLEKIKRGEKVETRSAPPDPESLEFNKNPKFLNQWTYIAPGLHSCFDWLSFHHQIIIHL